MHVWKCVCNPPHRLGLTDLYAVQVPMTLPRPELSETMGVTYRRIPILAIGRDIYADTSLIASTLERRYPASAGYGTLFPPRKGGGSSDTGMVKTLVMYYFDRAIFPLAAFSLPYGKFPEGFVKDRADVRCLLFMNPVLTVGEVHGPADRRAKPPQNPTENQKRA